MIKGGRAKEKGVGREDRYKLHAEKGRKERKKEEFEMELFN